MALQKSVFWLCFLAICTFLLSTTTNASRCSSSGNSSEYLIRIRIRIPKSNHDSCSKCSGVSEEPNEITTTTTKSFLTTTKPVQKPVVINAAVILIPEDQLNTNILESLGNKNASINALLVRYFTLALQKIFTTQFGDILINIVGSTGTLIGRFDDIANSVKSIDGIGNGAIVSTIFDVYSDHSENFIFHAKPTRSNSQTVYAIYFLIPNNSINSTALQILSNRTSSAIPAIVLKYLFAKFLAGIVAKVTNASVEQFPNVGGAEVDAISADAMLLAATVFPPSIASGSRQTPPLTTTPTAVGMKFGTIRNKEMIAAQANWPANGGEESSGFTVETASIAPVFNDPSDSLDWSAPSEETTTTTLEPGTAQTRTNGPIPPP